MPPPNVLLITCDQLRKDALGCYGNEVIRTPHIDRLAERGVRFDQVFAASPVCAPNRGSIATGRFPSVHGLRRNGCVLPESELTLMEVLRRRGYATYGVGKMHFGPQWRWIEDRPGATGDFDERWAVNPQPLPWEFPFYGFQQGVFTEDHRVGPYADYLRAHGLDPWADPHSFSYPQHITAPSVYPEEHHQTVWVADRSIEYLRGHPADRPFFLWTSFVHPHHPFTPPVPYDALYDPARMPPPVWDPAEVNDWPEAYRRKYLAREGSHEAIGMCDLTDADWRRIKAYYYGMISLIDKQVGRLMDELDRRGLLDRTIVVFTSDHGEMLGDHHLLFKGTHYDCVTNVPLIIARPGDPQGGQTRRGIAQSVDIMPTILELAGTDIPEGVQGKSLVPMLADGKEELYREAFIEDPEMRRTVRTPTARLTWHGEGQRGELYDLTRDPHCLHNLWDRPEAADLQRQLMDRLVARMAENVDPLPPQVGLC